MTTIILSNSKVIDRDGKVPHLPPFSTPGVDESSPASDLGGVFNVRFGTWQARLFLRRIKVTCGFSSVYRSALHTEECFLSIQRPK